MAVDPNFNWVRSLVQGASTENMAGTKWPTTVTGSTAGGDYLGLANGDLTVSPEAALGAYDFDVSQTPTVIWLLRQLVIANLPTWTPGARIVETEDMYVACLTPPGSVRAFYRADNGVAGAVFQVPVIGQYRLEVASWTSWGVGVTYYTLFVDRYSGALSGAVDYFPVGLGHGTYAAKTGYTRVGGGSLTQALTTTPDFTVATNIVTTGYPAAAGAVSTRLSLAKALIAHVANTYVLGPGEVTANFDNYRPVFYESYTEPVLISGTMEWRIGAGTTALPYFYASVNVAGLTETQAAAVAAQSLAAQVTAAYAALPAAAATSEQAYEEYGTTQAGYRWLWDNKKTYTQITLNLPVTAPGGEWPRIAIQRTNVARPGYGDLWTHTWQEGATVRQGVYGAGSGLPTTLTISITGVQNPDNGAAIVPSLAASTSTALTIATTPSATDAAVFFANQLAAETTSSTVTIGDTVILTLVTKSPMTVTQAQLAQVAVGRRVETVSGIDRLYGFRLTMSKADTAAISLPWPTSAIPPAVGGGPISASPLYLKFEDGAGNATAANSGTGAGPFTVNPHAIVASQHQDGTGSLQLTGAAYDSISFGAITGPGTGDYTAEMWVRFPSMPAGAGMFMSPYTHGFALGTSGVMSLFTDSGSSSLDTVGGAVAANVWYHVAAVRASGTVKFYFNGASQEIGVAGQTSSISAPFLLGEDGSYGSGVAAFVDEYRFTNSALYTADFTPTSPLDAAPPSGADVTGAGYNDVEEFIGSGSGNPQANSPDSYGIGSVTLDGFTVDITAYIDAADVTGTSSQTLAIATNVGTGVAATPTDLTGDYTLDDFTSAGDGVADLPMEFTADYSLDDFAMVAVGLFLAPAEGSGDSVLDDFAVTTFTASTITPPTAQATFSLPALRATASGTPTVFDGALLTLPALAAAAQGGHYSEFSLPVITAEATGTTIAMARAIMTIPMVEVEASGRVSGQSSVQARLPSIEVTSFGGHRASITLPELTGSASGTVGTVSRLEATLPLLTVDATGYRDDTARAGITLPMIVPTPSAVATVDLPAFTVLAHGQPVLTNAYEAYVLNMNQPLDDNPRNNFEAKVEQVTRYTNWPFIQVVRLGNAYYGVAEDGLYELGGATDNGTEITWSFETCKTDFDDPHKKAVASAYIGGQAGATVDYTLRSGDDVDHMYGYVTTKVIQKRNHRQKFGLGRRVRYYSFGLAGSGKAAIDTLEFELLNTTRRI